MSTIEVKNIMQHLKSCERIEMACGEALDRAASATRRLEWRAYRESQRRTDGAKLALEKSLRSIGITMKWSGCWESYVEECLSKT